MAARFAGFSQKSTVWFTLLLAGALAGIAGMIEVAGPIGQLTPQLTPGYGFTAIIVAFLGRLNPIGIVLAGLVMAISYIGGENAQVYARHAAGGDGRVPGNAAVLPARLGLPRPLPRPHPIRQAPPGGRHGMIDFLVR